MTHWTDGPSDEPGRYYWWRETRDSEPVIVRVVKSYDRLLAGPWAGGMKEPAEMAGWWMAVESDPTHHEELQRAVGRYAQQLLAARKWFERHLGRKDLSPAEEELGRILGEP